MDRYTYICTACRFTSKYRGSCPSCSGVLLGMYDLHAPKKRDGRGWKKIELLILARSSNIQLCTWSCCVPIRKDFNRLTLSQYRTRVHNMRTHHQDGVPRYYNYR